MKKILMTLAVVFIGTALSAQTYLIDTDMSVIKWTGKKVTGQHEGTIKLQTGTMLQQGEVFAGIFGVDMTSMVCTDLDEKKGGNLVGHLSSEDFFAVEKYNSAIFNLRSMSPNDDGTYTVSGDLTIKGITNEISFPATVTLMDGEMKANANFTIDRTKWDIKYGSGSFFDNLGDKAIYDDIHFELTLVSRR